MPLRDDQTVRSPDWWLLRLGKQLHARQPKLAWWDCYFSGDHPLPEAPAKARQAYLDFLKMTRTNFVEMVVSASVHRLQVIGVVDEQGRPDPSWRWWQANKMAAVQKQLWRTSLSQSLSYAIVGPHPQSTGKQPVPLITAEHPSEVIVETDPGTRERLAGLKAWYDPVDRVGRANLFLPEVVVKYTTGTRGPGPLAWGRTSWTQMADPAPHRMGALPVVPFPCRPDLGKDPLPEFQKILDIQDRINLGMLNRMTAERYSAFRQRHVTGHKFKTQVDEATGLEIPINPFVPDPAGLWASTSENAKFGEFGQTDLMGYLKSHEADIRDLLVISETPSYYYADLINIAADTVMALDTNHIAKVEEHQAFFGEAGLDVLALASALAGEERDFAMHELRWRDPRQLNPAVVADAAAKKKAIGYPLAIVAEDMGESPQRVERIVAESAADQLQAAQLAAAAAAAANPVPTPVPAPTQLPAGS